jgi:hypothetical protein
MMKMIHAARATSSSTINTHQKSGMARRRTNETRLGMVRIRLLGAAWVTPGG